MDKTKAKVSAVNLQNGTVDLNVGGKIATYKVGEKAKAYLDKYKVGDEVEVSLNQNWCNFIVKARSQAGGFRPRPKQKTMAQLDDIEYIPDEPSNGQSRAEFWAKKDKRIMRLALVNSAIAYLDIKVKAGAFPAEELSPETIIEIAKKFEAEYVNKEE